MMLAGISNQGVCGESFSQAQGNPRFNDFCIKFSVFLKPEERLLWVS
jgi:hypothetical protein